MLALVNDALIAAGKPTLGFLNVSHVLQICSLPTRPKNDRANVLSLSQQPWVYGGGYKALNDIVSGSSYGCDTEGFRAAPGWDAVTGYGTPVSALLPPCFGLRVSVGFVG